MNSRCSLLVSLPAAMAVMIAGCRGGGERSQPAVTYNCPANADDIRLLEAEIPAFTDSTGIVLSLQPFSGQEKLYAMMAAGQAPDIFYTNTVISDRLAAEGRLLDLRTVSDGDPFLNRLLLDVYRNGIAADGGLYSIGNWTFTAGVYYNRDLFDELGIPYPDTAWTWDDMVGIARRLTRRRQEEGGTGRYGIFIGSHFVELLEQMNGAPIPRRAMLADLPEESLDVYRRYVRLAEEGIMPDLRRMQAMGMQAAQLLQGGKVGMLVESVPHQTLFETLNFRWGIAPLPRFGSKPPRYFRSASGGLSISASTKHPAEAWKALKWIVAGASAYQPNPVLKDVDVVGGWEAKYPRLENSGFRTVWEQSAKYNGGDPRFFVRYSSWTSAAILEKLQPLLDRLWLREIGIDDLRRALPAINAAATVELRRIVERTDLKEQFRSDIRQQLEVAGIEPAL